MANPQTENGFLQIANEIWNEVIRRDFTKRQKDIILFIWRLSYGCKKKTALIAMLKDFELCGVGPQNITKELTYLVTSRVLTWDRADNIFSVNKDFERWQISPVRGWDEKKFKLLLHQNIEKKTSQIEKSEPPARRPKAIITSQNKKLSLLKTRSLRFLKQEVKLVEIPCRCKVERVSKERFKEIFKKRTITTIEEAEFQEESLDVAFHVVHESYCNLHKQLMASPNDVVTIQRMVGNKLPSRFIVQAMDKVYEAKQTREKEEFQKPSSFTYYENAINKLWKSFQLIRSGGGQGAQEGDPGGNGRGRVYSSDQRKSGILSVSDDELDGILAAQHVQ